MEGGIETLPHSSLPQSLLLHHHSSLSTIEKVVESSQPRAAVKLQKHYRSYRTRRWLADSAVYIEEYWSDATEYWGKLYDYTRLTRSTISFFNKLETPTSRWNRVCQNASIVGKGWRGHNDDKAQTLAFQHWIEAIDPRHRYGHSLQFYYDAWCNTKAGQPFFYWLDIGDGRSVDLDACPRSKLRKQCIMYFGRHERERYEYIVVEGEIVNKQRGEPLDTTKGSKEAKWIFVMSPCKKLYAAEKKKGELHHSSFLAGGVTLAAGRLVVVAGVVKSIWAYSGHYRPTDENLRSFLDFLKESGVNTDEVEIRSPIEDNQYNGDRKSRPGETTKYSSNKRAKSNLGKISSECNFGRKPNPTEITTVDSSETTKLFGSEIPNGTARNRSEKEYQRTLSGGLQSPRAEVSKEAVLERINSKKLARSYQSSKWSSGTSLRIRWVRDNPKDLQLEALELMNLSPKTPQTPSSPPSTSLSSPKPSLCDMETGPQLWYMAPCYGHSKHGISIQNALRIPSGVLSRSRSLANYFIIMFIVYMCSRMYA